MTQEHQPVLALNQMAQLTAQLAAGADLLDTKEWAHDRSKYMNASEMATCIKKQWYEKHSPELGAPQQWGFARRGQNIEAWATERLLAGGATLYHCGDEQQTIIDKELVVAGTPDGYVESTAYTGDPMTAVLDIKSIDGFTKKSNLPRAAHVMQVQINILLAMRNPLERFKDNPVRLGILLYVNASNYDDVTEFLIPPPPPSLVEELRKRAQLILATKKVERLDREGRRNDNGRQCRYCPYTEACGVDVSELTANDGVKGNKGSNLDDCAKELLELRTAKKENAARETELKDIITEEMTKRGVKTITIGNSLKVTIVAVEGRKSFDKKLAESAGVDVSSYYKQGSPSTRLDVEDLTLETA